jgi:hypothetical protein
MSALLLAEHVAKDGSAGGDRVGDRHHIAVHVRVLIHPTLRSVGRREEVQYRAATAERVALAIGHTAARILDGHGISPEHLRAALGGIRDTPE